MTTRWWAFGVWAVVAASAVYWALKLVKPAPATPPQATVVAMAAGLQGDLSRLLGADAVDAEPEPTAESSRFELLGVVASRSAEREGVALIAVDGKPPKAFRVGAVVDGETVVKSVQQREVRLGPRDGAATVSLDIAAAAPAATGRLPAPGAAQPAARALALPGMPPGAMGQRAPARPTQGGRPPAPQGETIDEGVEAEVQAE
ncbi:hypothetical protein [Rubrivivax gelatinosus]|uniref:hypothetical protein n=1 Tax=Rubrivivax gelatinosus TaxID=28068 RepID=UPI001909026A|nr:hypothetical protein [Rubrivivax gelatinosus]